MCSITWVGERLHKVFWAEWIKTGFHGYRKPQLTYNGSKRCLHLFSVAFDRILFILAGNQDMHKISDEFEFWPDRTTDYRVSCPWVSKKFSIDLQWENGVSMLAHSFLIESSSKLLVSRTGIKAQMSLISGRLRLLTLELLALEWRKFYPFEPEYLWGQLANLDQILCVASLGVGKGCMFWGRLDQLWCPWQQKAPIDL